MAAVDSEEWQTQQALDCRHIGPRCAYVLAEREFGDGMRFFRAWQNYRGLSGHAGQEPLRPTRLHYIGCMPTSVKPADIRKSISSRPELREVAELFLQSYQPMPFGFHRFHFDEDRVVLTLLIGDVDRNLKDLDANIDAWIHDPNNDQTEEPANLAFNFNMNDKNALQATRRATVIGAGWAGLTTAALLCSRGWEVEVIDAAPQICTRASAHHSALPLPVLSSEPHGLSSFSLQALVYFYEFGRRLGLQPLKPDASANSSLPGLLFFGRNPDHFQKCLLGLPWAGVPTQWIQPVTALQASEIAGIAISQPALYYSQAQVADLPALAAQLTARCGAKLKLTLATKVIDLNYDPSTGLWNLSLQSQDSKCATSQASPVIILCGSYAVNSFLPPALQIPLRRVRGQIDFIKSVGPLENLQTILCGDGFITPARGQSRLHTLGATYERLEDDDPDFLRASSSDHDGELRAKAENLLGFKLSEDSGTTIDSRWTEIRTSSPGQAPVIGQDPRAPGLYWSAAHISRGSIYAPLAAEQILNLLEDEPRVLPKSLQAATSAQRFRVKKSL